MDTFHQFPYWYRESLHNKLSQKHALRLLQVSFDYVQESDRLASINNPMVARQCNVHHLNTRQLVHLDIQYHDWCLV